MLFLTARAQYDEDIVVDEEEEEFDYYVDDDEGPAMPQFRQPRVNPFTGFPEESETARFAYSFINAEENRT